MKKNEIEQQKFNIAKNHPIKFLASRTGSITLLFGVSKIMFTLKYTDVINILSKLKNIFVNNMVIIMMCICIIVISTYVFIYGIKKLKSNQSADQEIIKELKEIINDNTNISNIEIHRNSEELSISMNTQIKENNLQPHKNLYVIKGGKEETNKEIKLN